MTTGAGGRVRERLRRGAETEDRITRGLGAPALAAIALSTVGSSLYFVLGVVADNALGFTPLVFFLSGLFFVVSMLTYVEGTSLHPERGGASNFARYAFNELWSFVAGWAIILDYLIVMAFGAFAVSHYLVPFWRHAGDEGIELVIAAATLLFAAAMNIRGLTAQRLKSVLRLSLINFALALLIIVVGVATLWDPGAITNSIHVGSAPTWQNLIFGAVVASVAAIGVEAASGLAGEIRVGKTGLRRVTALGTGAILVLLVGMSIVALMAVPVHGDHTALGSTYVEAPVLGIVSAFDPSWLREAFRYLVGGVAALVLVTAVNGQVLGVARLAYSLTTNRQLPSLVGRLHKRYGTPYVAIAITTALAFGLAVPADPGFLAGLFAFGAMIAFALAHLSVIVLRFRESERKSAFRMPLSVRVGGGSIPIPAAVGALLAVTGWVSVVTFHSGARLVGSAWMAGGLALYVVYRRGQGKSLTQRFTIPAEALLEVPEVQYGSILVPVFGQDLDDDIVGTAGRLAAEHPDEGEGGAVLEAVYVFEIPMSLPIDARVPDERLEEAKRVLARAKQVGEEYEGVEVATAMVRGRSAGGAIISEAKRRGVEAIILAAEEPSQIRGGTLLGGTSRSRDRFVGETTRYVVEKAPCKVILTAPPRREDGLREGVQP